MPSKVTTTVATGSGRIMDGDAREHESSKQALIMITEYSLEQLDVSMAAESTH